MAEGVRVQPHMDIHVPGLRISGQYVSLQWRAGSLETQGTAERTRR